MKTKKHAAKTKGSAELTLKDRLSRLTYHRACQLLGPNGAQLIQQGSSHDGIDIERDVYLRGDLFRLRLRGAGGRGRDAVVTITAMAAARDRLRLNCTCCETMCAARWRGGFVGVGREDGAGPGRPSRRTATAGNHERTGVARPGSPRPPGTSAD